MTTFQQVFDQVPAGRTMAAHWAEADPVALDAAAATIATHGANPWVFSADARHFWQFAGKADVAALDAMDATMTDALLGWADDDWDPATFGYRHPDAA